ncbi:4-alpha-glucanotransferase [Desulfocastanea catecholica]
MLEKINKALQLLGITNFLLGVHDAAFPSLPEENLGRGSPYSAGAADFFAFAASLGFTGVQLGPQGITTEANPSPYDGSFFSRNPLSLAPLSLIRSACPLLERDRLAGIIDQFHSAPDRVDDIFARLAIGDISTEICRRYRREVTDGRSAAWQALSHSYEEYRRQNAPWLERDALYQLLRQHYAGKSWRQWDNAKEGRLDRHLFAPPAGLEEAVRLRREALGRQYGEAIDDYCFIQFLLAEQHRELRQRCRRLGLQLFGDLQIGMSGRDAWYGQSFLLAGYVMGAPPSRTNPEGQPWNYAVLDPHCYFVDSANGSRQPGPALLFLQARIEKLVDEFDGLRLDHPHGLICPWVYTSDQADPFGAVQNGARLFASPMLPDHPALAQYAIVRPEQLNTQKHRYDDNWVTSLDAEQVGRYAQLLEVIIKTTEKKWANAGTIACEILSTQPYPVKRVMDLYGLGRFRVTQKADLTNTLDVYRSENARPEDWLMLGNHDTPTIWQVADRWQKEGVTRRQAEYLAIRLRIPAAEQTSWKERLAVDAGALVQAKFADLFVGPAQNIMVYFTDLLGGMESYNKPGTTNKDNWTLRISCDFKKIYREKLADDRALNIPKALAMALRARDASISSAYQGLIRELEDAC